VVPDDQAGATVEVTGKITQRDETERTVRVELAVTFQGKTVLGRPAMTVRLA
jgi:hypothetical protein